MLSLTHIKRAKAGGRQEEWKREREGNRNRTIPTVLAEMKRKEIGKGK